MVADIQANANSIEKMRNNAALYVSAQQFMTTMAADTIKATNDVKLTQSKTDATLATVLEDLKGVSAGVDRKLKDAQEEMNNAIKKAADAAAAAAKRAKDAADAADTKAKEDAAKSAAATKKLVDDALKPLKAVAANYATDSLFFQRERYQLLKWRVGAGKGAGRVFYKVDFNPGSAGLWNHDRREFFSACTALSNDLKARDGVDRALKPACNNPNYCDGNGVRLPNSYLSHYGCNTGTYNVNLAGYGLPIHFTMGSVMYNPDNRWNGHEMLTNSGKNCEHFWTQYHDHTTRKGRSTLCTGSNSNWKSKPV